jgi:hypothetical protein
VGCQCAQRILPTQTKYIHELSIIVDYNCHQLSSKSPFDFCLKKIRSIRLIRRLEQIILLWVANAPSAFFQPTQNIFTNCRTAE